MQPNIQLITDIFVNSCAHNMRRVLEYIDLMMNNNIYESVIVKILPTDIFWFALTERHNKRYFDRIISVIKERDNIFDSML